MLHPSDFGTLRAFAAVAENRSFTQAADALGVSSSALSQMVRGLEERIGARLLNRTTRSVSLTEAGTRLLADAGPALNELTAAFENAREHGAEPAGTVRVHCFHAAAETFVAPVLPALVRAYPRVVLDLTIDDTALDFVAEGYDAAIHIGEVVARDLVAQPLGGEMRQIAVAAPGYLAEHGAPATPGDLLHHRCIRWRWPGQSQPYAWEFCQEGRWFSVAVDGPIIASSRAFTLQAALDGVGIAFLKEATVAPFIAAGRLVPLLEAWAAPFPGFFLCTPRQRQMAPALQVVVEAIVAHFGSSDALPVQAAPPQGVTARPPKMRSRGSSKMK